MKIQLIKIADINRNLFETQVSQRLIETANYFASNFKVNSHIVLHESSYELISGELDYQAAVERGETEIEVLLWDIPDFLIFGAKLMYTGAGMSLYDAFPIAEQAMDYFSFKKDGPGARMRKQLEEGDTSLAEFVAALFNTNRTDLYRMLAIGNLNKRELLLHVDSGQVSLLEAERVAKGTEPKENSNQSESEQESTGEKNKSIKSDIIKKVDELRPEEVDALQVKLVQFLNGLKEGDTLPAGAYIERVYTHVAKNATGRVRVDHLEVAFVNGGTKIQIIIQYDNPE